MSIREVPAGTAGRADRARRAPRSVPVLDRPLVAPSRAVVALAAAAALAAAHASPAAPPVAGASRLAGISGAGVSGIQITNLDPADAATAEARFYKQTGAAAVPVGPLAIAPLEAANVYLPTQTRLTNGAYAALVDSDRPVGSLARTDWPASGAAVMDDAAPAGTTVTAPLVARRFDGLSSLVTVQNLDTAAPATVGIAVRRLGEADPVVQTTVTVPAGTSRSLDLVRNPAFADLPDGFAGSLVATAATPIAVHVFGDFAASPRAVFDHHGAATGAATLHVPRIRAGDASGAPGETAVATHDTWIAVANVSAASVDVTVRYAGLGGGCAGLAATHGGRAFAIPAGASLLFSQGADGAGLATGASGLPAGCVGSARVEAAGAGAPAIAAAVVDLARDPALPAPGVVAAGSYDAFRTDEAVGRVMAPLFRHTHTGMRLSSEVTVLNPGSATATVRLRLFDRTGAAAPPCDGCEVVLPAGAAHTWRAEDTGFAANAYGSARVESDTPVVAVVADASRAGTFDTSIYRGHGAPVGSAGDGRWTSSVPFLSRASESPAATATPSPGGRVSVFAIGFVDAFGGSDPACPGCDGVFDPEDETLASQQPLPRLTYVLLDDAGQEVARTTSEPLASLQRAVLDVPRLAPNETYTLVLQDPPPSDYALCTNETARRLLHPEDFVLGSVRRDFHFTTRACTPPSREPGPAVPTAGPPVAAPKDAASSGVMVANLGEEAATLTLDLFAQTGGAAVSVAATNVPRLGSYSFYLPALRGVAKGAHAGIASGDAAIGTLTLTSWSGSLAQTIHDDAAPATDIVVPWVVKGADGQNTIVAVQNHDAAASADVRITLTAWDGTAVASVDRTVGPGTSILLDIGRDPAFAAAPIGFMGTLRARAATRIAATALIDYEHSRLGIAGFNGEPAVSAATTLLVPLARHHAPVDPARPAAGWNETRIAIANPGAADVDVTARFTGVGGTCADEVHMTTEPAMIPADGVALFDLAAPGVPEGCAVAARFDATGGVLGVAFDTVEAAAGSIVRTAAAYNIFRGSDAARTTPLPIVRRVHTTLNLSTDIAVMNPGTAPAAVEVEVFDARLNTVIGCGAPCAATIAPGATHLFVTDAFTAWPLNRYGSATVNADRPVLVTAADVSRSLTADASMYRAGGTGAAAGPAERVRPLPLLLNQAMARLPGGPLVAHQTAASPPDPSPLALVPLVRVYLPLASHAGTAR